LSQTIGGANSSADGKTFPTVIPSLSDTSSITDAFKYYHQGQTNGSPATNSVEKYLIDINSRAKYIEDSIGYTTYNPVNNGTTNSTYSINTRLVNLESSVGTSLASSYIKMVPSSNSVTANRNIITPSTAAIIPLTIQGYVGQTANLQEWQTSAATVAKVDSTGKIFSYDGTSTAEVATISGTQTFTNKTLTTPIQTIGTNVRTTSYVLTLTDQSKIIEVNSSSATTVTIPGDANVAFPVGTYIVVLQTGTGQVTIDGQININWTITINGTPGFKTRTQWSMVTLIKRATNTWVIAGDLTP
jgi:hypothetical protein